MYCAPNINKYIVNLWKLMAYFGIYIRELPWIPVFKVFALSSYGISIAKSVPFVPLLAEVAGTHIDTRKSLSPSSKYYMIINNNDSIL